MSSSIKAPESDRPPLPTQWSAKDKCVNLAVHSNGLIVEYKGINNCYKSQNTFLL